MNASKYWLVYYGQRQPGRINFPEAHCVIDKCPGEFLADLLEKFPDHESRVTMAVEISAATYRRLKEML